MLSYKATRSVISTRCIEDKKWGWPEHKATGFNFGSQVQQLHNMSGLLPISCLFSSGKKS